MLEGNKLAGGQPSLGRVEHDFYATSEESILALIEKEHIKGCVLEPCVGAGHIANVITNNCTEVKEIVGVDIVDRGYKNVTIADFVSEFDTDKKFDWVVTNPPYKFAQDFVEKSFAMLKDDGHVAMFLKIQFLEGVARRSFFEKYPPKTIYVFSKRQTPLRNGQELNPKTNKKWSSTMCFAWFVWQNNYKGDVTLKWI